MLPKPASPGFLCSGLVRWLEEKPERCLRCWEERTACTAALIAEAQWHSAYRLAGGALEVALLMMRDPDQCGVQWLQRYRKSKKHYSLIYEHLSRLSQREAIPTPCTVEQSDCMSIAMPCNAIIAVA